jgi:hypothetical protein
MHATSPTLSNVAAFLQTSRSMPMTTALKNTARIYMVSMLQEVYSTTYTNRMM